MDELYYVMMTGTVIGVYFLAHVIGRKFDPFAPVWLFLVGYAQPYIIQAVSYHEWAIGARGKELVAATNFRALWALMWFLAVYQMGIGRKLASLLPRPPRGWSATQVTLISPPLIVWGLFCAGMFLSESDETFVYTGEEAIFRSFPFVMMVASILLIVTGRMVNSPMPQCLPIGLAVAASYVLIWVYHGKRSHSLIAVLATFCAFYCARVKRPSWPVLMATACAGVLVVALAIGWRGNNNYERSFMGLAQFVADFKVSSVLQSLNISDGESESEVISYETTEYGGTLLMMDTVPDKSDYDYGANYIRVFSTFIPRIVWPTKPLFGRAKWVNAWIAGSEMDRDEDFASPAIGILGATQLNGGTVGTVIVLACLAILLRTSYEYFRRFEDIPWVQFWWSITYFNAWFMVVNDDPLVWFYYNWGFTTFPVLVLMWWGSKMAGSAAATGDSNHGLHG